VSFNFGDTPLRPMRIDLQLRRTTRTKQLCTIDVHTSCHHYASRDGVSIHFSTAFLIHHFFYFLFVFLCPASVDFYFLCFDLHMGRLHYTHRVITRLPSESRGCYGLAAYLGGSHSCSNSSIPILHIPLFYLMSFLMVGG
jgi:hypothetical protein